MTCSEATSVLQELRPVPSVQDRICAAFRFPMQLAQEQILAAVSLRLLVEAGGAPRVLLHSTLILAFRLPALTNPTLASRLMPVNVGMSANAPLKLSGRSVTYR